jgi:hypothetical protein
MLLLSHFPTSRRGGRFALLACAALAGWLAAGSESAYATCGDYLIVGNPLVGDGGMAGHGMPEHGNPSAPGAPVRTPCHGPECSSGESPAAAVPSPAPTLRDPTFACFARGDGLGAYPPCEAIAEEGRLDLQTISFRLLRPPR